jgi:PGF-pre-PGF domain-containing protein
MANKNKFRFVFLFFLAFFSFNFVSSQTLTNTTINATGINAVLNISGYTITFDELDVFDNAITFYNLAYTHPNSCNNETSTYTVYNYTTSNSISDLPSIACVVAQENTGGGATTKPAQITNYINLIANQSKTMNITNSHIDLTGIAITADKNITGVSLIITEEKNLPNDAENGLPLGLSYQSFEINLTKVNSSDITSATINFKVNKTWMTRQNATTKDITLYRKSANETLWNPLNTNFLSEDSKYYYFNALTPGFSTFLIFLYQPQCVLNTKRCSGNQTQLCSEDSTWVNEENCPNGCENGECLASKSSTNPSIIFIAIVVIVILLILVAGYILFKKLSKNKVYAPYSKV